MGCGGQRNRRGEQGRWEACSSSSICGQAWDTLWLTHPWVKVAVGGTGYGQLCHCPRTPPRPQQGPQTPVELTAISVSPNPAILANPSIRTLSNLTRVKILTKHPITLNRYYTLACSLLTTALPTGLMPSLHTCRAAAGSPPRAPPEAPRESDYMAFSASQCPTYCCVF